MRVILYSNHCPCCEVLESRLKAASISHETVTDTTQMLAMGMTRLPMLSVDGDMLNYPAALAWLRERTEPNAD